ncbi:ribosomal-protein-alanine N-acetyltransferase [compost metagenome]
MEQHNIRIAREIPDANSYADLRKQAGLSPRSEKGIHIGLGNSLFAVTLYAGEELIGMGRVVGDGGCFFQIVDIAVRPDYQGQGLGKAIMEELMNYLQEEAPSDAYVSLIADQPADKLYLKYGFQYTAPESLGMYMRITK